MRACYFLCAALLIGCGSTNSSSIDASGDTIAKAADTADASVDVWRQAQRRGVSIRGIGQEPGWLVEITEYGNILIVSDYGTSSTEYSYVEPTTYPQANSSLFQLDIDNSLLIETTSCSDSMSGERFTLRLTLYQVGRTLKGCGRILE